MRETRAVTAESAAVLAEWAGLAASGSQGDQLAEVFREFQERAQRLYAVDVSGVEFDFLRALE